MKSLRSKLIVAISLLIICILAATGYVLIDRKIKELTSDIYKNGLNFAQLSSGKIVDLFKQFYLSNSYSYFVRDMESIFALNPDVSQIKVINYAGDVVYDSETERNLQYKGEVRKLTDPALIQRIQDVKPSVVKDNQENVYLKANETGGFTAVTKNEQPQREVQAGERIQTILFPVDETYRVLYSLSYRNLDERVMQTMLSILILLFVSALVGIIIARSLAGRIVRPIRELMRGAVEVGKGNLDVSVTIKTKDELKLLGDTFNKMTVDLKKSTEALIEQERIGKELEIARGIQQNLLPKVKAMPGLDLAAGVIPAQEVGGDCFDFIEMPGEKNLLYIGDVTGHGVPSGLVVSMANSLIYSYSKIFDHPKDILAHTNSILQHKTAKDMFMTVLMASWDPAKSVFTYTQAGHDPLFYFRAADQTVTKGMKGGMALGMIPDISKILKEVEIKMEPGDVVVLFTDGYPESFRGETDETREILGFDRFGEMVKESAREPTAQAIYDEIIAQVKAFTGNYPQFDDMTMIVVRKI